MKKTAIVLFNLGGPDNLGAVKGFLFNLFCDPAIIGIPNPFRYLLAQLISRRRAPIARKIYEIIGGKSPILEITNSQAELLEKELSFSGDYKVFTCMRYWHPMSKEVVSKVKDYEPSQIIMLPLYPQFSTTTTASSFKDFTKEVKRQKLKTELKYVCCYPENNKFIKSHVRFIQRAIERAELKGDKNYRLLFSAHGLPQGIIDAGDPYVFQIQKTTESIIKKLGNKIDYRICYQSKVGPMKWTAPSLDLEIKRAALDKKGIIVIPIAFVSDHSETLVELDVEYKEMAKKERVPFYYRVNALNGDGYFIDSLKDICLGIVKKEDVCNGGDGGKRICPKKFKKCINFNY